MCVIIRQPVIGPKNKANPNFQNGHSNIIMNLVSRLLKTPLLVRAISLASTKAHSRLSKPSSCGQRSLEGIKTARWPINHNTPCISSCSQSHKRARPPTRPPSAILVTAAEAARFRRSGASLRGIVSGPLGADHLRFSVCSASRRARAAARAAAPAAPTWLWLRRGGVGWCRVMRWVRALEATMNTMMEIIPAKDQRDKCLMGWLGVLFCGSMFFCCV